MKVLGINCGYGSGCCLLEDGRIVADVQEERFVRVLRSRDFPSQSLKYCLTEGGITDINTVDYVAISSREVPLYAIAVFSIPSRFVRDIVAASFPTTWGQPELVPQAGANGIINTKPPKFIAVHPISDHRKIKLVTHHQSHAAMAHFTRSSSDQCLVFTMDDGGGGVFIRVWLAEGSSIKCLRSFGKDAAIGSGFSLLTEALGWRDNQKTMELSAYGDASKCPGVLDAYFPSFNGTDLIKRSPLQTEYRWFMSNAGYSHFDESAIVSELCNQHGRANLAAVAQLKLEESVSEFVQAWIKQSGASRCAFSGELFANTRLNYRIWAQTKHLTSEHYISPCPGDAGLARGAALDVFYRRRTFTGSETATLYTGPSYTDDYIESLLLARALPYLRVDDPVTIAVDCLLNGNIVGWFQGRMESGEHSLGNRAVLADPRKQESKALIGNMVKRYEDFRPLSVSILLEHFQEYIDVPKGDDFMSMSLTIKEEYRKEFIAVMNRDNTVCPQMVRQETNELFWRLIDRFGNLSGVFALVNASFCIEEEPVVNTPSDAIRLFYDSGIDVLILGNCIVKKHNTEHVYNSAPKNTACMER